MSCYLELFSSGVILIYAVSDWEVDLFYFLVYYNASITVDMITIRIKNENNKTVTIVPAEKVRALSLTYSESINFILLPSILGIVDPVSRESMYPFTTPMRSLLNKLKSSAVQIAGVHIPR